MTRTTHDEEPDVPLSITKLDHLVLTVRELERTRAFYVDVLGLEPVEFAPDRHGLRVGAQRINLHVAGSEFTPHAASPVPGSADLCLVTETPLEAVAAHFDACGVPVDVGPVDRVGARRPLRSLYVHDPDGNLIEISNER